MLILNVLIGPRVQQKQVVRPFVFFASTSALLPLQSFLINMRWLSLSLTFTLVHYTLALSFPDLAEGARLVARQSGTKDPFVGQTCIPSVSASKSGTDGCGQLGVLLSCSSAQLAQLFLLF